ncbi:hypothetical protein ACXZ65_34350 [Streptomyces aculeolatus]
MFEPTHQSVRDYIAAKKAGDTATADRIILEVTARFETGATGGDEVVELLVATVITRSGG